MYPAPQPSGAPAAVPNGLPQPPSFQKTPLQSQTAPSFNPQFQTGMQNMNNQFGNMNIRPDGAPHMLPPNPAAVPRGMAPAMTSQHGAPQFAPAMSAPMAKPSPALSNPNVPLPQSRMPQFTPGPAPGQANGPMRPATPSFPNSAAAPQPLNTAQNPGALPRFPQAPRFANGPPVGPPGALTQPSPTGAKPFSQPDMTPHNQPWAQPNAVNDHQHHEQHHSAPNFAPSHPAALSAPSGAPSTGPAPSMGGGFPYGAMPPNMNAAPQTFPQQANTPQGMQPPFGAVPPPAGGMYSPSGYGNAPEGYSAPPPMLQQNQFAGAPGGPPPGMYPPPGPPGAGQYGGAGAPPGGMPGGMYPPNAQPPPVGFPGAFPGAPPMMNGQQQFMQGPGVPPMGSAPFMGQGARKPGAGPSGGLTNDGLPSVIDVLDRDINNNGGQYFESRLASVLPPLVTTKAPSRDMGNTIPELLRSSLYVAPATTNLLKESGIPFVLHMQPMAELPADSPQIPIVYHGDQGPVRCNRCKAYMSPYMKFIDGGRKFQCPFCFVATEVPQHYFQYLDSEGRRVDMMQRPELCLGTYEFLATKDYCKHEKLPEPPAFIFMIDVSYRAISSGFVGMVCNMLRNELESLLPVETTGQDSKLRVGFATFSDSVHFFNLKANLNKPSMMTVNDFTDMFVPIVDGFLVKLEESGKMLDSLLEYIPQIFANSRETDTILYPVIQSGMRALEAAGCPGKLFVFNFSLPVLDAPGKLKNREDRTLLGTDKEKTLLKPQIPDYSKLGEECVSVGCCVDLFLFPNQYVDVATIGEVSRMTGGQIYKYNFFQPDKDGNRFLWDLRHDLKRNIAFDAVMRVRTNAGVRPTDYFGNMYMPNTTEVHLAALDSEKAILAEIKHDDKLEDKSIVHIQVALLYTSLSAQRRVRVMNLALNASTEFPEMYRCAEIDVIMNFMMKNSLKGLFEFSPAAIREGLAERTTKMLVAYRKHCSSQTPAGQLVLPESLKLLPIYTNCLSRSDIVSGTGSDVGADDRSWLIAHANALPVEHSTAFLYPRLYVLNEVTAENPDYFRQIRCTQEKMQETGCYLLENSIGMFLWVGRNVDGQFLQDVFGAPTTAQIEVDKVGDLVLSATKNPAVDRIKRFIDRTRATRPLHMRLTIVRQGDATQENWFRRFLVEDKGVNAVQQSYVDFIYYLYNQIRDELEK
ncbi:protein transport protein Sec24C-like isoform X2 [Paramacrobiotus metropolitanus]|uniref:protein transport protein Sec24C-like isoform X2 n=1 Tax=Paramacrobiotus metropolitanus TaxID=2943436 RepID=UPI0024457307|nr:protein transport protein Sec24C-like isoform X2 [Paramacrobiotus metropolitanus]